jgi:hypothetical protein
MTDQQTPPAPASTTPQAGTQPPATPPEAKPGEQPQAGSTPPEAGKTGEQGKPPADQYDLKAPKDSLLDSGAVDRIKSFAKEKGLSPDQAQALLERESANVASFVAEQQKTHEEMRTSWLEQARTDKEIGGDNFNANTELAKRVVERFGTDEFKKALDESGLGNHPELVRILARIGKAMGNDTLVVPGSSTGTPKQSMAERLYPSTPNP